jgi:S-adenosylmethionine synthetase
MCRSTAAGRKFGRENAELAWERVDAVDELQADAA